MTFDMQAARKNAETCNSKDESIDHDYWNAHVGMVLPAALNEIDRLQLRDAAMQAQIVADVRQQAKQVVSLDATEALIRKNAEMINEQANQIATLKAALIQERKAKMQLDASRFGMGIPEEIATDRAKEQLAQAMPDIFEETK